VIRQTAAQIGTRATRGWRRATADAHSSMWHRGACAPPVQLGQDAGWFCPMLCLPAAQRSRGFTQPLRGLPQPPRRAAV